MTEKNISANNNRVADECRSEVKGKPLGKLNFWLMGAAGAMIILGFLLMLGAPSGDTFNPDIFSTRRIVVGPTIAFIGYIFMGFGIMWRGHCKKGIVPVEKQN